MLYNDGTLLVGLERMESFQLLMYLLAEIKSILDPW